MCIIACFESLFLCVFRVRTGVRLMTDCCRLWNRMIQKKLPRCWWRKVSPPPNWTQRANQRKWTFQLSQMLNHTLAFLKWHILVKIVKKKKNFKSNTLFNSQVPSLRISRSVGLSRGHPLSWGGNQCNRRHRWDLVDSPSFTKESCDRFQWDLSVSLCRF